MALQTFPATTTTSSTTPKCAELLENGHILSGDENNCLPTPVRLKSGNHLIRDQYNHRVIEVNRTKQTVRKLGKLGDLGYNHKSALIEDSTRRTKLNESATRRSKS